MTQWVTHASSGLQTDQYCQEMHEADVVLHVRDIAHPAREDLGLWSLSRTSEDGWML